MHKKSFTLRRVVLLVAVIAVPAQAELYKWTDAEGHVHFTDKKPDKPASKVETLRVPRATGPGGRQAEASPAVERAGTDLQRQKQMADILSQEREQQEQASLKKQKEAAVHKRKCMELQDYRRNAEGSRLYNIDDQGERIFMDEKQQSHHMRVLDEAIQAACQ